MKGTAGAEWEGRRSLGKRKKVESKKGGRGKVKRR